MDLSDLRVFQAVVTAGGITRAAELLHRVPSNVTTRIKNLEDDLGVALFSREGRRLQLSPQGKVLLDFSNRLLSLAEQARNAMHEQVPRGVLHLGAMESTAAIRLPSLLGQIHERYPELSIELCTGAPRPLTIRVLSGELDAALVAEPVSDPRLDSLVACTEQLVIIGPVGHPPIRSAHDIRKGTLLVFEPDCPHRQRLEAWCARDNMAPRRIIEVGSYHAILGCCVAGMGVALIPAAVLDTYTERARLSEHKLKGDFRTVRTMLIWRKDSPQFKAKILADLIREEQLGLPKSSVQIVKPKTA
ncbi:LysR family transcriptional regulator [Variovorax paradoxus]|jgi:DNA-binding transcriptional LysR family regulator|uniref:LysR family transcriptional regulator n=1 Tax=Variovorax paradoxus TaxID=34073 RepID=UPI00248132C1|nr:LysR family transcriptional regulator [Variovorax paradoxus]WGT62818.1 LysR substrate-binding domain-containing protein [Variovorax paradoxus]